MGKLKNKAKTAISAKRQNKNTTSRDPKSKHFVSSESVTGIPVRSVMQQIQTVLGTGPSRLGPRRS